MPRDGYSSVSIPDDKLERATEYKPDDVSWGACLVAGAEHLNENLTSDAEGYRDASVPAGLIELAETAPDELDEIKRMLREATEAAQSAEQSVEELKR